MNGPDAGEIARLLAAQIDTLVLELLPGGKRNGREWRAGSLAGEAGSSLSVQLVGDRRGQWIDHNGEVDYGDALHLVAAVRYSGNLAEAITWAKSWLRLSDTAAPQAHAPRPAPPPRDDAAEEAARIEAAKKIWLAAPAGIAGTPVEDYLAFRGIHLRALGAAPNALRCHPALYNRESGQKLVAMVAAVTNGAGAQVATHRTWLQRRDGIWRKAELADAKMSLGVVRGGWISLRKGASGKPVRHAPEGDVVAIAEGIETALSIGIACPELRVLAAVSIGNFRHLALPPAITEVIICADNDPGNDKAARALDAAVEHFGSQGRRVRLTVPAVPGADWNDVLLKGQAA